MLYRFRSAATAVQINKDLAEIRAALPRGAVMSSVSWLLSADQTRAEQDLNTPSAVAFALLGLALAALIVGSVVSALVVAGYRRIGVLKSIGFTPLQVAVAYAAQVAVPTVAGCATGVILGNYWVLPMLGHGAGVFHLTSTIPAWIDVAAPLGICAIAGIAALIPALKAGSAQSPRSRAGRPPARVTASRCTACCQPCPSRGRSPPACQHHSRARGAPRSRSRPSAPGSPP